MKASHKNLVIDIGNNYTKIAVFQGDVILDFNFFQGISPEGIELFCKKNNGIARVIVSSVKDYPEEINIFLKNNFHALLFDHQTPLPIGNTYATPQTLGNDRIAAAVGIYTKFKGYNALSIDAGTAITYDFVDSSGVYYGGGISPGIMLRYKALNHFTGRLPLVEHIGDTPLIGIDTNSSIASGVLHGVLAEMNGIVENYLELFPDLKIILTGGDYKYFDKRLKFMTFATSNLVLEGLNQILNYNCE